MAKKIFTLMTIFMLFLSTSSILISNMETTAQISGAEFTGVIFDSGLDVDYDGKWNFLEITIEVNVSIPGQYGVEAFGLWDEYYFRLNLEESAEGYLGDGLQNLTLTFSGIAIYGQRFDPKSVGELVLYQFNGYRSDIDFIGEAQLSRIYNHTDFDQGASLTGLVLDAGIDIDTDGLLDFLQVMVEINVTDAGYYSLQVGSVFGNNSAYVTPIPSGIGQHYDPGLYLVNLTVPGVRIYAERLNPEYVGPIWLHYYSVWPDILLDWNESIPLLGQYSYDVFESHAFFTGRVFDQGVDEDQDSLFDHLEVGVEINVTEAGGYILSSSGLAERIDGGGRYIHHYQYYSQNLSWGLHVINFTFPGSMIAYYRLNPSNITDLHLADEGFQLGYMPTAPLSRKYNYTEFNHPFNDMEIELTIYPNATLGITGWTEQRDMYLPYYDAPLFNATLDLSTVDSATSGILNGSILLPEYLHGQYGLDSAAANLSIGFDGEVLNAQLNATLLTPLDEPPFSYPEFPIELNSTDLLILASYNDGAFTADLHGETKVAPAFAEMFPFNVTDLTFRASYLNQHLNGSLTFHVLSGFPLQDLALLFDGNQSHVSFEGSTALVYGSYFGVDLNATILEAMLAEYNSTLPGRGDHSLFNMTNGMIECTALTTKMTPILGPPEGAQVGLNMTIHGNLTHLLAEYIVTAISGYPDEEARSVVYNILNATLSSVQSADFTLNYWHTSDTVSIDMTLTSDVRTLLDRLIEDVPETLPPETRTQIESWLRMANATIDAIQTMSLECGYSGTEQLIIMTTLTANITQLEADLISILPSAVPPEFSELIQPCTNTTYCTLEGLNAAATYADARADFNIEWLITGDFNAEANHVKSCYVKIMNFTSQYGIPWQVQMLNMTQVDVDNLRVDFTQGDDWMTLKLEQLVLRPEKNQVDQIRFQLEEWLSMTGASNVPGGYEKLKLVITAGSNGTHTILLHAPSSVARPNSTSLDYKTMVWENTTVFGLRDMLFKIAYQGTIDYLGATYLVPIFTNSTVSDFSFEASTKSISFNVTGTMGRGFANITVPRNLLYAPPEQWTIRVDGAAAQFEIAENDEFAFIYVSYSHSSHRIEVQGTWVVAEFPTLQLLFALLLITLLLSVVALRHKGVRLQSSLRL